MATRKKTAKPAAKKSAKKAAANEPLAKKPAKQSAKPHPLAGGHPITPYHGEGLAQLQRVRTICMAYPETMEKISHGEPNFFLNSKGGVFAACSNNHHNDGIIGLWIPAAPGLQEELIKESPKTYYRPPYVGVSGWVGINLLEIGDDDLAVHIHEARQWILEKQRAKSKPRR
jgi:hypothetical protein